VLEEVGLLTAANQRAGTFSLGMRQRLALAGALLGEPEVLLLDEPANGLDPDGIRWLRTYLRDFADSGGTVFVSSHLIAELAMFVDDLVVIGGGKLLAVDTIDGITAANETTVLVGTPHIGELTTLLHRHGLQTEPIGDRLAIRGTTRSAVAQLAFEHRLLLDELTESSKSLEDSLIDLTSGSAEFASA
jgi:ABC-2 type transport system ATP-binding protein